ncbi:hypothetical protein BU17DRAFT_91533 [Hysterangium stoloniferum]|nr:hypothetical protein BU17DRAFT_91533 [Hysterangium stoloniferum]
MPSATYRRLSSKLDKRITNILTELKMSGSTHGKAQFFQKFQRFRENNYVLLCVVVDNAHMPVSDVFPVEVPSSISIGKLKENILEQGPSILHQWKAPDFFLWKPIDLPTDPTILIDKVQALRLHRNTRREGGNKATFLDVADVVSTVFNKGPTLKYVNVLVQLPASGDLDQATGPSEALTPQGLSPVGSVLDLLINTTIMVPEAGRVHTERGDNRPFKLYQFYVEPNALKYPETLTCSLTGVTISSKAIVAAHLWKYETGETLEYFGFHDIDNPRNGLLLYKPIEEAYDRHLLCFYQDTNRNLRCRVLSNSLRTTTLNEFFNQQKKRIPHTTAIEPSAVQQTFTILQKAGFSTFGDLEQPSVYLRFPQAKEPFKHVLNLHAIRAYRYALQREDISIGDFNLDDFYSEEADFGAKALIERWRKSDLLLDSDGDVNSD